MTSPWLTFLLYLPCNNLHQKLCLPIWSLYPSWRIQSLFTMYNNFNPRVQNLPYILVCSPYPSQSHDSIYLIKSLFTIYYINNHLILINSSEKKYLIFIFNFVLKSGPSDHDRTAENAWLRECSKLPIVVNHGPTNRQRYYITFT